MNTKKLTTVAMLSAMAYVLMFISKAIPAVQGFLQYDAKDVVITIGGFMLGPVYALIISLVVSLLELVTVSDKGIIGLVMNIVSTAAFSCTASLIYHKVKSMKGAYLSLAAATIVLTAVMLLWNYYITPLYMHIPRSEIVPMMPIFLYFNLVKGLINSGFILFTYKPIVTALQRAGFVQARTAQKKMFMPALITGIVLVVIFIPVILHMANVL